MAHTVSLRPWRDDDLPLLQRLLGEPGMTVHIGGPETAEQILARHRRYIAEPPGRLFAITLQGSGDGVGWIGYWEATWHGDTVWETGWHVLPEFQGRGLATAAAAEVLVRAHAEASYRFVHAFPAVGNRPSNAVCRKTGFVLSGEVDVEYPKGRMMRANDWRATLPIGRCDECGAPLSSGRTCMENFHELLMLEASVPGAAGGLPHFFAVASYGLQHPGSMGFTAATVEGLRQSVVMAVAGEADIPHLRSRSRQLSAVQGRVTRRGDEVVPAWPVPVWDRTVTDVLARGAEGYEATVRKWAASIVGQTSGLSPAR